MRQIDRIDRIQCKIKDIWKTVPDMRYFQFTQFLADLVAQTLEYKGDLFFVEDDKLEEALDKILERKGER